MFIPPFLPPIISDEPIDQEEPDLDTDLGPESDLGT